MSNYRRVYVSGGTYFFTVVTYRRQLLFHHEMARHFLKKAIAKTRQNYPFIIEAWVLLPEHLHCIWTLPEGDDDFSIRWNLIKSGFSKSVKSSFHRADWMTESKLFIIMSKKVFIRLIGDAKQFCRVGNVFLLPTI